MLNQWETDIQRCKEAEDKPTRNVQTTTKDVPTAKSGSGKYHTTSVHSRLYSNESEEEGADFFFCFFTA